MPEALASTEDIEALTGDSTLDADRVSAMLASASARFRREAQQDFTVTETTAVVELTNGTATLHGPVTEISAVTSVLSDGSAGVALTWSFDGNDTITVGRDPVERILLGAQSLSRAWVTWSHGYDPVPEDVRWAVAAMVQRALQGPSPGVTGETIGGYSWQAGGYTASGALSMSKDELALARGYRSGATVVRQ